MGGGRLGLVEEVVSFISRKLSFLFLFLFTVEGLGFFFPTLVVVLVPGEAWVVKHFNLVSRLKEKEDPMVMEREVVWPWAASTWQNSRHLAAKSMSLILVVILSEL